MKNLKFLLFTCLSLLFVNMQAQEELKTGSITMEIVDVSSDNEQVAAQLEMMKGTATKYIFSEEKSYTSAEMMGGMFKMQTLVNNADENMTLLIDVMGQKMMVESTKDDRKEMEEAAEEAMEGMELVYDEADTKEILGYKCVKATLEGGESGMGFSMYIAKDVKASNKMIQGLNAVDIEGFPLEYILETDNMTMRTTATELLKEIDPKVFELNTSGFTSMTFEEFQEQMGAMGGGMGF